MTLTEAIKSRKPFKLPLMRDYLYVHIDPVYNIEFFYWLENHTKCGGFPVSAILSTEWYLLETPDNLIKFPVKTIPINRPPEAS